MPISKTHSRFYDALLVIVPLVVLVGAIAWYAVEFVEPAPPHSLTVAAAVKGSPYYNLAARYQDQLAKHGIRLAIRETSGSFENLKLLNDPNSGVEAGFLQGGIATSKAAPDLESLGRVLYEPLWIFRNANMPASRLSDLKGRRILVGPAGGGTNLLAMQLLAASGITAENARLTTMELPDYVEALNSGAADVGFLVLGANAVTIGRLFASSNVKLMPVLNADAYAQRFPFLNRVDLKAGIVDFGRNLPEQDTAMVTTIASFVIRNDMDSAIANLLTQVLVAVHGEPVVGPQGEAALFQGNGELPLQADPAFRVADEAKRVYRVGPPFLQRYMPFWIATIIDRMTVMVIPLIGLLIPAFRIAPLLYRWRIRGRLLRWYGQLKLIEDGIKTSPGRDDITARQKRVEEIEVAVDAIKLPIGFANQLYDLRQHIDVVRRRLAGLAVTARQSQL